MVNLTIGLPNVVLDGVIDVLKTELDDTILAVRSRDGIGFASLEPPFSCYGRSTGIRQQREPFSAAFRTLAACSVVHTTWLGRARRALGSSLVVWPKLRDFDNASLVASHSQPVLLDVDAARSNCRLIPRIRRRISSASRLYSQECRACVSSS